LTGNPKVKWLLDGYTPRPITITMPNVSFYAVKNDHNIGFQENRRISFARNGQNHQK
jgi:hypothetical protein